MPEPLVTIAGLQVAFHGVPALHGIDLAVAPGESLGLVGESGCGKSVTWLAALGLLPRAAAIRGSVRLEGQEILGAAPATLDRIRGGRIATIFQDPASALNPVRRVGAQVAEAVRLHRGHHGDAAAAEAVRLLDQVGIPAAATRARLYPHELSGGQNQRVMIAMALAGQPELLVADEPTTALDATIQAGILDLLRRLQAETGMALVLISHDLGVVAETCARVCVMYAGRIVEDAPAAALFDGPAHPYTRGLLAALPALTGPRRRLAAIPGGVPEPWNLPPGCASPPAAPVPPPPATPPCPRSAPSATARSARPPASTPSRRRARCRPSHDPPRPRPRRPPLRPRHPLRPPPRHPCRRRREPRPRPRADPGPRGRERLRQEHHRPPGAGLERPDAGTVRFDGAPMPPPGSAAWRRLRARMQLVPQDPLGALDRRLTIAAQVQEPLTIHGLPGGPARVAALLDQVGLRPDQAARHPHALSGGQRQRAVLARALATDPALLVLDEPVSALDVSIQAGIVNLLADIQAERALAMLFISHDLKVVRQVSHAIAVMYLGRIVEHGTPEEILERPAHPYTIALVSAVAVPGPRRTPRVVLQGDPPNPADRPPGCAFHPRCPARIDRCLTEDPMLLPMPGGRLAACHLVHNATTARAA